MSCHHAAPLVRQKPHVTCLVGFLQEADEVTQEQQSWGEAERGKRWGKLGTSVSIKGMYDICLGCGPFGRMQSWQITV